MNLVLKLARWSLMATVVLGIVVGGIWAQDKPAAPTGLAVKYTPNEVQMLRLENAQLKAKLAQQAWSTKAYQLPEFTTASQTVSALQGECHKVILENKWPATVTCNIETLAFLDTAEPTPAPEKK